MVLQHSQHQKEKIKFWELDEGPHGWASRAAYDQPDAGWGPLRLCISNLDCVIWILLNKTLFLVPMKHFRFSPQFSGPSAPRRPFHGPSERVWGLTIWLTLRNTFLWKKEEEVVCFVMFYGISTLGGYPMLNPVNINTHTHTCIYIYIHKGGV